MKAAMRCALCGAVAMALPACSSREPSSRMTAAGLNDGVDSGAADGGMISCEQDPLVEPYAPKMTQPGTEGVLRFVLVSAQPAPPALGLNDWVLEVLDASGAAQEATFVEVKPWMPYHGHGASVVPQVSRNADGSYSLSNLDFFMVGVWQVTLDVQTADGRADSTVFSFCVGE